MGLLATNHPKNSIAYNLILEQLQPLLDNDYILPRLIFKQVMIVFQHLSPLIIEPFLVSLKMRQP